MEMPVLCGRQLFTLGDAERDREVIQCGLGVQYEYTGASGAKRRGDGLGRFPCVLEGYDYMDFQRQARMKRLFPQGYTQG
jgi:hypothetical protein